MDGQFATDISQHGQCPTDTSQHRHAIRKSLVVTYAAYALLKGPSLLPKPYNIRSKTPGYLTPLLPT